MDSVGDCVTLCVFTGQCGNCCDSSHCLLVEEEQKQQTADRQVARHVLLVLLLTVSLVAVSINVPSAALNAYFASIKYIFS